MTEKLIAVVAACAATVAHAADIQVTTDTPNQFAGTFSVTAADGIVPLIPSQFQALPGSLGLELGRDELTSEVFILPQGTPPAGDDPSFAASYGVSSTLYPDVLGDYTGPGSTPVSFIYYDLQDTGGVSGAFSGAFTFVVPEPTSLAMCGMLGVSLLRRRRA